jgi:hypothetical protein
MFKVIDLTNAVGKAISEEDEVRNGRGSLSGLVVALLKVRDMWTSQDCVTYKTTLGKLLPMQELPQSERDAAWNQYTSLLNYGNLIAHSVTHRLAVDPDLPTYLGGLYTNLALFEISEEVVDAHFANSK